MASPLENAIAGMKAVLNSAAGETVTYHRDSASVDVTAIATQPDFAVENDEGLITRFDGLDWMILAADLILSGSSAEPKDGDQIRQTRSDGIYVYEVMAPQGLAPFNWVGPYRLQYRVHTKLKEIEDLT